MNEKCTWADILRWHAVIAAVYVAVFAVVAVAIDPIWWSAAGLLTISGAASAVVARWLR